MRLLLLSALLIATPAVAQLRAIPDDAQLARMRYLGGNLVELDGKALALAPGAQIRDVENRIVFADAVPAGAWVRYRLEIYGLVHRVWLLSGEEAARVAPPPKPQPQPAPKPAATPAPEGPFK
jgi:hypothetical protein